MIRGHCLCNKIAFEAEEIPGMTFNCHCLRCQKSHGSAFSTQIVAKIDSLKFLRGENYLSEYQSPKAIRTFCSHCGTRLMNYDPAKKNYLSVAISSVDKPHRFLPAGECFITEKYRFVNLDPDIPHYKKFPQIDLTE